MHLSKKLIYIDSVNLQYNMPQIDHLLDIKIIDEKEFNELCKDKNLETYTFEWNFFKNTRQDQNKGITAGLLNMSANNMKEKDSITMELLVKYLNF